jgi:hypothetical protein
VKLVISNWREPTSLLVFAKTRSRPISVISANQWSDFSPRLRGENSGSFLISVIRVHPW